MQTCVRTALDDLKEFMKVRWFLLAEKKHKFRFDNQLHDLHACRPEWRKGVWLFLMAPMLRGSSVSKWLRSYVTSCRCNQIDLPVVQFS